MAHTLAEIGFQSREIRYSPQRAFTIALCPVNGAYFNGNLLSDSRSMLFELAGAIIALWLANGVEINCNYYPNSKNTLLGQQHLINSPRDNNDNKGVATTGTVADADADADTYTYTMQ